MTYFQNKQNGWGHLDIDMNVHRATNKPVENVYMSHLDSEDLECTYTKLDHTLICKLFISES